MKLQGEWLQDPGCQQVFAVLAAAGYQVFVVGGAVRDAVLNRPVGDVDFATSARPDTVMDLARDAGINVVPTGLAHGTLTLVLNGTGYEVTSFRKDVETDGRRAVIAFTDDVAVDAFRRDFTMNALYARADGTLVDPLQGWSDLVARRVRFIGRAEDRIDEDALRILRFFRFYAIYGDPSMGIDVDGLAACAGRVDQIDHLSAERIGHEMRKCLAAENPAPALAAMAASGVLARVAPGAAANLIEPLVEAEAGAPPDWQRRLGALGGAFETHPWRFSRAETRALKDLRKALDRDEPPAISAYRHGERAARNAALIRTAALGSPAPASLAADVSRGAAMTCPLTAADLLDLMEPGPGLGAALKKAEAAWIASEFRMPKADLLKLAMRGVGR